MYGGGVRAADRSVGRPREDESGSDDHEPGSGDDRDPESCGCMCDECG
ncbi:hypothetical protein TOK_1438 [Pseudonocardia sp. N23]|nr:hypothetical protein TOK_1438 [Pseudonocardia sp. N23]